MDPDPSKTGAVATLKAVLDAFPRPAERAELLRLVAVCQGCGTDYSAVLQRTEAWRCTCHIGADEHLTDVIDKLSRDLSVMAALSRRIEGARLLLKAAGISWWSVAQHFVGNEPDAKMPETLAAKVREVLDPKLPEETKTAESTP